MSIAAILHELDAENATTRRVLERVPADRLTWKPHPKSMSLGELALHLAQNPGMIAQWAVPDAIDMPGGSGLPVPASTTEILAAHDESAAKARAALEKVGDDGLNKPWQMMKDGVAVFAMPKSALIRTIVLNHTYHHRGQLSVYLRLLDVPVPSIYGPSADEAPAMARV